MPTQVKFTRKEKSLEGRFGGGFGGALLVHGALFAFLILGHLLAPHKGDQWGENQAANGAIQATMVNSLPLPPTRTAENGVLASETPSPAPVEAKAKAEPPPPPDAVPVPVKKPTPTKTAEKPSPEPPKHPQPTPPQPKKAQTGDTAGVRIPQATVAVQDGSASVFLADKAFGAKYAYYVNVVNRRVAQDWHTYEAVPNVSAGKRVVLIFDINTDGVPENIRIETPSGSPSLDQSAVHAVERVEGFGQLPGGQKITVEYIFDYKP